MNEVLVDKIVKLTEGNPGALSVILQFKGMPEFFLEAVIDYLLEYGPRGSGIWMLYKDSGFEDFEVFAQTILGRMQSVGIDTAELATQAMEQMLVPVEMLA